MKKPDHVFYLFVVIILEGYVVLSTELLAIRETIPFVGSGTDTVSIIIAAVLMPLAFGYDAGGRFVPYMRGKRRVGVREKLIFNILTAMLILLPGLSYAFQNVFFLALVQAHLENRLIMTAIYAALFIVGPVYLLGQTIPLVSNYFSKQKLAQITGRILFFSTVGSFVGAVFSTLVLMSTIGVHHTASLVFIILAGLVLLLSRKKFTEKTMMAAAIAVCALALNSGYVMSIFHIVEDNKYNTIAVYVEDNGDRNLVMNNTFSSMLGENDRRHPYVEFAENIAIKPIMNADPPRDILVVGAGAFTFGLRDQNNKYDYLDIDSSLQKISETYILREKLSPNKRFIPLEVRAYFMKTDKKYDVIFLDAYLGDITIPEHLVTREFFLQVKKHLKPGGIVMANFVSSPNFLTPFSRNIDSTFRAVFANFNRHVIYDDYLPWNESPSESRNAIYIYRDTPGGDEIRIYTDNKNTAFLDKPKTRRSALSETPKEAEETPLEYEEETGE